MKKFLYFLAALLAVTVSSCKEDDGIFSPKDDLDRMPMTMFRKNHNTNISNNSDPYATKLKEGTRNTVQLYWYGVEGCAGYEIRYAVSTGVTSGLESDWDKNKLALIKVGPEVLHMELKDLDYSTDYRFAIRVLHPDGKEEHHSRWYGMGSGQEWEDWIGVTTAARYATPNVIFASDKEKTAFNVYLNMAFQKSAYSVADQDTIMAHFKMDENGLFVGRTLMVIPDAANPDAAVPAKYKEYEITDADIAAGKIRIDGLSENSTYVVRLRDKNFKGAKVDSYYNDVTIRTKGDPGAPILLKHVYHATPVYPDSTWSTGEAEFKCMRIDTIIENFNRDPRLAEGQTFYLEGGKAYYFFNNTNINKGFTMETDPADVAKGLRAKVYVGGICAEQDNAANTKVCNFMFGKALGAGEVDAPIQVENVMFRNIDFSVPLAQTYAHRNAAGSGNYFANMYSNGRGVYFDSFTLEGCTFQGFVRGFIRTQGSKTKVFKQLKINNCVFYNDGYYDNGGGGYSVINADAKTIESNVLQDCRITNCTFYDTQKGSLINLDSNAEWDSSLKMSVTVENNTFINFGTRKGNALISFTKGTPGGSKFTIRKNLFVLAASEGDERALNFKGADIRNITGSGLLEINVCDNWAVGCKPDHDVDNGIFTGAQFTATKNSFGGLLDGLVSGLSKDDLVVKVSPLAGGGALRATQLFENVNPPYKQKTGENNILDHAAPKDIFNALKYKNDITVTSSEIYKRNIGDQRWKDANPSLSRRRK